IANVELQGLPLGTAWPGRAAVDYAGAGPPKSAAGVKTRGCWGEIIGLAIHASRINATMKTISTSNQRFSGTPRPTTFKNGRATNHNPTRSARQTRSLRSCHRIHPDATKRQMSEGCK